MTLSEARKLAVEAAARDAYVSEVLVELVMAPYLATMADAGWRMARDVGDVWEPMQKTEVHWAEQQPDGIRRVAKAEGWNACRAAMLDDANG